MISAPARRFLLFSTGLAVALTSAAALGRAQAPRPEVAVEFLALTKDGTPVTDLDRKEITLRVGGRQRTVKDLRLVRFGDTGAAAPGAPAAASPSLPFATNAGGGGAAASAPSDTGSRNYFLVIDTDSMRPSVERPLRDAIEKFLSALTPRDRVGLLTSPRGILNVPPSTDHAKVRATLAQLSATGTQATDVCRTREVLDGLTSLLASFNPSNLTNVVLMSAQLSASGTSSGCEVTTSEFQRVQRAVDMSRTRMYVVMAQETVAARNEGLETLAGVTNAGQVIRLAAGDNPLARIARETSAHYVATFDPEASDRTDQMARLELRVTREGVVVRSSNEISMGQAAAPAAAAAGGPPSLITMLKSTAPFTALPLRGVAFFPKRGENNTIMLLGMVEAAEPGVKLTSAGAGLVNSTNTIVHSAQANEKQLALPSIVVQLTAPTPGPYKVRFVAIDDKGRGGAVDYAIDADLATLGPLKFSGLILGAPSAAGCQPKMQFTSEENICVILEMYGAPTAQMSATLEIVAAGSDKALSTTGMGGSQTPAADVFNLSVATVPIASLAPGDYVARAKIGMQGAGEVAITRPFRKAAK